jgi:phytoene dehydrogenase-like protein
MSGSFDAIVIGAGHNGLVAGSYLAKAGRKVLVLEARDQPGGAAVAEEIAPGYRVPVYAHLLFNLDPVVARDLQLERHGLCTAKGAMGTVALDQGGRHLVISEGLEGLGGRGVGADDLSAWSDLSGRLRRFAATLSGFLAKTPPRLGSGRWDEARTLFDLGWKIRRLGRDDMREFLRVVLLNVADLVEDEVEDPLLQAAIAFDAVLGGWVGPRSPGTVLPLLYRLTGEGTGLPAARRLPQGGVGALTQAMTGALREAGGTLRCDARVAGIRVEGDRATGVVLEDGEIIAAGSVLSNVDPKRSFLELIGPRHLDAEFTQRANHIRTKGATAKLNLALSAAPRFSGLDEAQQSERLLIAPSIDDMELAFNALKYGELPQAPPMEIVVPSLADPSIVPEGGNVLSAVVQYVPYAVKGGWDAAREDFQASLIAQLEAYAPGLRDSIVAAQLLTPADIEERLGTSGGHWHHGELAVDQMLMLRPFQGVAQYETPIEGFYLCGAGAHPGGDLMGTPGRNAARRVLRREGAG